MRKLWKSISGLALMAIGALSAAAPASAQSNWPKEKAITIVQPFAAGSDYLARLVAAALETRLGQSVHLENRPGAGGATGTAFAARQAPDGYTLVMCLPGPGANFTNSFANLPYKPLEDFVHISQITVGDMVIVARKDFPANTLPELIAYAKANPGKVTVGNNGIGSYGHMIALLLADTAKLDFKHVPYKGSPQIATDMMNGALDLSSDYLGEAYVKHIQAGNLKAIAVPSAQRTKLFPNTPTFAEAGVNITAVPWQGIMAPKGTPAEIVDKINAALADYLGSEEAVSKFAAVGNRPSPTKPEAFHAIVVREEAMWRDIIKNNNIRAE